MKTEKEYAKMLKHYQRREERLVSALRVIRTWARCDIKLSWHTFQTISLKPEHVIDLCNRTLIGLVEINQ